MHSDQTAFFTRLLGMTDLAALPDPLPIAPLCRPFEVTLRPPGSKSLTCRAYVLAALARGVSRITGPLRSDDPDRLLAALTTLGAGSRWEGEDLVIEGVAGRFPRGGAVDLGEGGAPSRFMLAAACLAGGEVIVDGSTRMRERPVGELIAFLRGLGANLECLGREGHLPVRVNPAGALPGGELPIGTTLSSQSISAICLIAPWLQRGVRIRPTAPVTSASYLAMTLAVLEAFGADVEHRSGRSGVGEIRIAPCVVRGREYAIEPDATSATYWLTAAALHPGATARIEGLSQVSLQEDARYAELLVRMNATVPPPGPGDPARPSLAIAGPPRLGGIEQDLANMPDSAMSLSVAAARAEGPSRLSGLTTLKVKETDRIAALAAELSRIGCTVQASDDALQIDPAKAHDRPVCIRTYGDHRMAMAFAILGLARAGISIENPACVSKSYPGFWQDLSALYRAAQRKPNQEDRTS